MTSYRIDGINYDPHQDEAIVTLHAAAELLEEFRSDALFPPNVAFKVARLFRSSAVQEAGEAIRNARKVRVLPDVLKLAQYIKDFYDLPRPCRCQDGAS